MSTSPDDDELDSAIAFALRQFPYKPPRTRDISERERYFRAVARAIRKQLQFAWLFSKKTPQRLPESAWKPSDSE